MKYAINPYVRRAWNHRWSFDMTMERVIYDHEIIYIDKGCLKFTIDKKEYFADEGSCVIIPPNLFHKIEGAAEETFQPHVHFDFVELPDSKELPILVHKQEKFNKKELSYFRPNFFKENDIFIPYVIKLQHPEKVRKIIFDIIDSYTQQKQFVDLTMKGLVINLVSTILEDYYSSNLKQNYQSQIIYDLISHMIDNINHNFTLEEMAEFANMSIWNLIQTFNKMYDTTPKKYFEKYRLLHAKTLLEMGNMSIKEIAYEMEFDSPQTFTRWFKNVDGKNPTFYKKQNH